MRSRYLLAENCFSKIDIFEQRNSTGGLWNYTPDERTENIFTVPLTDPHLVAESPTWDSSDGSCANSTPERARAFVSPVYERLETNLPKQLMRFSDLPFTEECQLFPKHHVVNNYIQEYGADLLQLIEFETQVVDVSLKCHTPRKEEWAVRLKNLRDGEISEHIYDAVVVASGHFNVPFVPDILGIREWNDRYPGSICHSKYFRRPEEFKLKVGLLVFNPSTS